MENEKKIGLWPLTSLVTGNLVGSGSYLLPASLAVFGSLSLFGWIITSVGALFLALVFSELSARTHLSGGPYQFARHAFGDTVGYFVCWSYWMLSWISNPALAVAAVGALTTIVGPLSPLMNFLLQFLIMASLTLFNLRGIQTTGRFELVITSIKVIPLIGLPLIGLFYCDFSNFTFEPMAGQTLGSSISSAAVLCMWAFIGLETGTVPAGNVKDPTKTVPRATIIGTSIAAFIYIIGTLTIFGIVPMEALLSSPAPYADAANHIFGGNWSIPIAVAIMITCLGTLNGWIIVVARIPYGAAMDGIFPKVFKKLNQRGTPHWSVIISFLCSLPLLFMSFSSGLLTQFNFLIDVAVTQILMVYITCVAAYFVIMKRKKALSIKTLVIGGGGMIYGLWALYSVEATMLLYSFGIIASGLPMYWMVKRQKNT